MGETIVAVDPGREKCGVAAVHKTEGVLWQGVIAAAELEAKVAELFARFKTNRVIVGDGTGSQPVINALRHLKVGDQIAEVITVDERHTTEKARARYWRHNPPRGWRRLLPVTLQVPPVPVDDYVAILLAERYFNQVND